MDCTICSMDGSRETGFMDPDLYRRIVDDAASTGVTQARLFLAGEPLLHPDIAEFVRYAGEKGLLTNIHTNASLLDREMSRSLLDAGLRMITFSFDGETREEYGAIRRGGDFDSVLGNILSFLEMKLEMGSSFPETTMQVIRPVRPGETWRPDVGDEFRSRFRDLPLDRWLVIPPHNWTGDVSGIGEEKPGKVYFPCQLFWQSLSIAWDGRVVGCCGDLNGGTVLGDLREQTIAGVWNSPEMVRMRELVVGKRPESDLCRGCTACWRDHHPVLQDILDFLGRRRS
jgi:MoaA/NifB/PqqE/SkfB family radical SAM enzyme